MKFLDWLWLDAETDIGKTQLQKKKQSNSRSFFKLLTKNFTMPRWYFSNSNFKRFWGWAVLLGGVKPPMSKVGLFLTVLIVCIFGIYIGTVSCII